MEREELVKISIDIMHQSAMTAMQSAKEATSESDQRKCTAVAAQMIRDRNTFEAELNMLQLFGDQ